LNGVETAYKATSVSLLHAREVVGRRRLARRFVDGRGVSSTGVRSRQRVVDGPAVSSMGLCHVDSPAVSSTRPPFRRLARCFVDWSAVLSGLLWVLGKVVNGDDE